MALVRTAPEERLNRLEFSGRTEWLDHAVDVGIYVCPHCSSTLEFKTGDFGRHERTESSNLDAETSGAFSRFRPVDRKRGESYLDFRCPGCGRPARLLYRQTDEWAMGSHGWRVTDVVEVSE